MHKYRRVTQKDRHQIEAYIGANLNLSEIAKRLQFHKSTISRELKRGAGFYRSKDAHAQYLQRFSRCRRSYKIQQNLCKFVEKKLRSGWSPEQISGRLRFEGAKMAISHQSIYRFIKRKQLLKMYLRLGYKRRGFGRLMRRSHCRKSSWKRSIRDRPLSAQNRSEIGHWERDLFFGTNRKTVLILSDRKSRYVVLKKSPNFKSQQVAELTNKLLKETKAEVKTITNDNGSEFFDIASVKVPVYFCDVQRPQQRGTIENTIGLLRQYIKRETNLDELSPQKIKALQRRINNRPRKVLDYRTPYEVFYNQKVALAI